MRRKMTRYRIIALNYSVGKYTHSLNRDWSIRLIIRRSLGKILMTYRPARSVFGKYFRVDNRIRCFHHKFFERKNSKLGMSNLNFENYCQIVIELGRTPFSFYTIRCKLLYFTLWKHAPNGVYINVERAYLFRRL